MNYRIATKIVLGIVIFLAAFAILAFATIAITEPHLRFQWDRTGLSHFVSTYDIPIKSLAAAIATLAIWLTLVRISQTGEQLRATIDNNRFNNYYAHVNLFYQHFERNELFIQFHRVTKVEYQTALLPIYKMYYYESYHKFEPSLNEDAIKIARNFLNLLINSQLNQRAAQFHEIQIFEIEVISDAIDRTIGAVIDYICNDFAGPVDEHMFRSGMGRDQVDIRIHRFKHLCRIHWAYSFYRSLLSFDKEVEEVAEHFMPNHTHYRAAIGFPDPAAR